MSLTTSFRIAGVDYGPFTTSPPAIPELRVLRFGAYFSGALNDLDIRNITVGTTGYGSSDVWAPALSSTADFTTVTGTGLTVSGGVLSVSNGGTDAYGDKDLGASFYDLYVQFELRAHGDMLGGGSTCDYHDVLDSGSSLVNGIYSDATPEWVADDGATDTFGAGPPADAWVTVGVHYLFPTPPPPPPGNDNVASVFDLAYYIDTCAASSSVSGTNVGATKEAGEPNFNGTVGGSSVWWWFTSNGNGPTTVTVNGTGGAPLASPLLLVYDADFNDWSSPAAQGTNTVTFTTLQDEDYAIGVDGAAGDQGTFTVTVTHAAAPANDNSAGATVLSGASGSATGTINWACAAPFGGLTGADPVGGFDVWYEWTAPAAGWTNFTVAETDAFGSFGAYVFAGGPGAWTPLARVTGAGPLDFETAAGETYWIIVGGVGAGLDRFSLSWSTYDLTDVTEPDFTAGPGVSTNTYAVPAATPAGVWLRFDVALASGAPNAATDVGLLELRDAAANLIGRVRLSGDRLQYVDAAGAGNIPVSWHSFAHSASLDVGHAPVRVELFFNAGSVFGRIDGVPVGSVAIMAAGVVPVRPLATVEAGVLWNTHADAVTISFSHIGIRNDPRVGPWGSADAADKQIHTFWGGEGQAQVFVPGTIGAPPPAIVAAPGVGASPLGRAGFAADCSVTASTSHRIMQFQTGHFSGRAGFSYYFYLSSYPTAGSVVVGQVSDSTDIAFATNVRGKVAVSSAGAISVDGNAFHTVSAGRWHHVEVFVDGVQGGRPTTVRLNGVPYGPFSDASLTRFVPNSLAVGHIAGATPQTVGLAVTDVTVYSQHSFPLGGNIVALKVPNADGTHDADVPEWSGGTNTQTPLSSGNAFLDWSASTIGLPPTGWAHDVHFPNDSATVEIATIAPPAAMVGQRVYYAPQLGADPGATWPGSFITDSLSFDLLANDRYLFEAWVYIAAGDAGAFESWAGLVADQAWSWPTGTGAWVRVSLDLKQLTLTADHWGINHKNLNGPTQVGPITVWQNYVYEPRSAGFWQSADGGATYTAIQNSDAGTFALIDEVPGAAGAGVVGVSPALVGWDATPYPTGNASKYVEYQWEDAADAPLAAAWYVLGFSYQWHNRTVDPATGAATYPPRTADLADSAAVYAQQVGAAKQWLPDTNVSGTSAMLPVAPDDAAWTAAAWSAWRTRLGFPALATDPNATVEAAAIETQFAELLVREAELPPEQAGAIFLTAVHRADPGPAAAASPTAATVHLAGVHHRADPGASGGLSATAATIHLAPVRYRASPAP